MDSVGVTALGALAFALVAHGVFLSLARLAGTLRSVAYPTLVIATASILAWQGLVDAPWLPVATGAALLAAAGAVLLSRGKSGLRLPRPTSWAEWAGLFALGTSVLYAAFPGYRPDQWNNDLVLPKVVLEGPLRPPVFEEHVYFGGNYQYLLTLPRRLSANDLFNHGAADAFAWLLLILGVAGLLSRMRGTAFARLPSVWLLLTWFLFGLADETAAMNAKPDPLILLAALAVLDLSLGPAPGDSERLHAFGLGFLLVAPLALKLTWLHFLGAAAVAAGVLAVLGWRPPRPRRGPFLAGVLAACAAAAPYLLVNARFFGNPVHPAQLGPFRTDRWDASLAYYEDVVHRAGSLPEYAAYLARLPVMLSWHLHLWLVPPLLVVLLALATSRRLSPPSARGRACLVQATVTLAAFVVLWPFVFHPSIYMRYVYAGLAMAFVALVGLLDAAWGRVGHPWIRSVAPAALLVPALANGALVERISFMTRFAGARPERLFVEGPAPWPLYHDLLTINEHRRATTPGAFYFARATLTDMEGTYLLDGVGYRLAVREYALLERAAGGCVPRLLKQLDVAYLRTRFDFRLWPAPFPALAASLPSLDRAGHVRYLSPERLAALPEDGCPAAPPSRPAPAPPTS